MLIHVFMHGLVKKDFTHSETKLARMSGHLKLGILHKPDLRCGTWGHVLVVGLAVLGQHLDSMILGGFSNLNESVILRFYNSISCTTSGTDPPLFVGSALGCSQHYKVIYSSVASNMDGLKEFSKMGDPAWCQGCCFAAWRLVTLLWWGSLWGAWLIQTDSGEFIPANCKSCCSNTFDKNWS